MVTFDFYIFFNFNCRLCVILVYLQFGKYVEVYFLITLFVPLLLARLFRRQMNGGVSQDMGIGAHALRSIHSVEMVCTTRYVSYELDLR